MGQFTATQETQETTEQLYWTMQPAWQAPKSVTAFDLFTFFRADLIQSEASWKLSSTSDWLMKECVLIKGGHTFGLLAEIIPVSSPNVHTPYSPIL